jgi:TonB C terminal
VKGRIADDRIRRVPVMVGGVLASLVIHSSFLSVLLDFQRHPRHGAAGLPKAYASVGHEESLSVVLVSDPDAITTLTQAIQPPTDLLIHPLELGLLSPELLASPRLVLPIDRDDATDAQGTESASAETFAFGRYLEQLQARIERAWVRPRASIGEPVFKCSVQVETGTDGLVRDVHTASCNGSSAWKESLVQAIRTASPLPVIPDRRGDTHYLAFTFSSLAYEDSVEPSGFAADSDARRTRAQQARPDSTVALQSFVLAVRNPASPNRDLKLTLDASGAKNAIRGLSSRTRRLPPPPAHATSEVTTPR